MKRLPFQVDAEALSVLCRRHGIRRLAVFGSAVRDELRVDSDIDILVEFAPGRSVGLRFITIQDELSELFGRQVDLNTPAFLSPHFREDAVADAIPIYEAA